MTENHTNTELISQKRFTKPANVLLLSLLCTALWGSAFPCIKIGYQLFDLATDDVPGKLIFAGVRFFFAGLITLAIYVIQNRKFPLLQRYSVGDVLKIGLFQTALQYICFYVSLSHIAGVKGSVLNSSNSFFVVLLAHFFYKNDRLSFSKLLGCVMGIAGIVVINLEGFSSADLSFTFLGEGCMLLSGLCFAIGSLLGKRVAQREDVTIVTGYQLGLGGLILTLLGVVSGGSLTQITFSGILLLAYMSLLSSVAFVVWATLGKYNTLSRIAVYNFLTPIFGALLSALILGETLFNWNSLIALVLVCIGIYIVNAQNVFEKLFSRNNSETHTDSK